MKWTAYDYYTCLPFEFDSACRGLIKDEERQRDLIRFASWRIHQSLTGKESLDLEPFWPVKKSSKKKQEKFVWGSTPEEAETNLRNFLNNHGLGNFIS